MQASHRLETQSANVDELIYFVAETGQSVADDLDRRCSLSDGHRDPVRSVSGRSHDRLTSTTETPAATGVRSNPLKGGPGRACPTLTLQPVRPPYACVRSRGRQTPAVDLETAHANSVGRPNVHPSELLQKRHMQSRGPLLVSVNRPPSIFTPRLACPVALWPRVTAPEPVTFDSSSSAAGQFAGRR